MAYVVSSEQYFGTAAATNLVVVLPPHSTNDIIVMHAAMDTGTCITGTGTTGAWTSIGNTTSTNNTGSALYRRMSSGAETISITTTDAYTVWFVVVRDADTTTALDIAASATNNNTATSTPSNVAITTSTNDALILYFVGIDGIATQPHSNPGVMSLGSFDSTGTTATTSAAQGASWYIQRIAGTTPAPAWTASAAGTTTLYTIAIRNKSGGTIPAYIDDVSAPAIVLSPGNHIGTLNTVVYTATLTSTASISGKTVSGSTATAGADFGINPYSNAIAKTSAIVADTALSGYQITFTGNRNLSTSLIMGSLIAATPKTGTFSLGSISQGGLVVRIGSSSTAWCAYQVAARDSKPTTEQRYVFSIQPGYTGTSYGTPGTAVTTTAVSHIQFLLNCPKLAALIYMSELYGVSTQVIAGGDSANPVDTDGVAEVGKSFRLSVIQKSGGYGLLSYAPLQIGGGDAVNFQIDAGSLQFPRRYDALLKEISYHGADNAVGISYAGKSGDVIKHTNSVITSPTSYYWEINSAATSGATWDFSGLVVVNGTVTLRNVTTFDTMTFSSCSSVNMVGCTFTNSNISKPPATTNSLIVSATTVINSCDINTTTIAAGNALTQTATPQIFSSTVFTGSNTSGHAIEITATGSYTFSALDFIGYGGTGGSNPTPSSGSTSAAIYNNSGGSVTINISGGGSTPSVRNGASSTTTVVSATNLTLTGFPVGTDIVILAAGTNTILIAVDSNATSSYTYSYSVAQPVDIGFIKQGYIPFYIRNLSLTTTDSSIPVSLTIDRNYI